MRSAKTVFIILAVILVLPWLIYNIKVFLNTKDNKRKFPTGRLLSFLSASALLIIAVFSLYRFTIGYQIQLAAERYGEIFIQRVEGRLSFTEYEAEVEKQNLSSENSEFILDEELYQAGFENKRCQLSLSERTYPMEDGSMLIYLLHDDGQSPLYTLLQLEKADYKWLVSLHEVLSREAFEELNDSSRIKFLKVKGLD
ncbi:MAG TPA: hypothetical protein DIW17_06385 [Clostridiales bacterium]|nr:hypothetical protein [Clostridiales bacterium]